MADPRFPNVPRAPGVPPVARNPLQIINDVTLLTADAEFLFSLFGPPQWGLFQDGVPLLIPDSIVEVEFKADSLVSDYPLQDGAFASFNKVGTPFVAKVQMTKGGTDSERGAFLQQVAALKASLDLVDVVMPEITYPSANLVHYDFRRTSRQGVGLLTVDAWLVEIRETGTAAFTQTAQPSGADPVNTGIVQPGPFKDQGGLAFT